VQAMDSQERAWVELEQGLDSQERAWAELALVLGQAQEEMWEWVPAGEWVLALDQERVTATAVRLELVMDYRKTYPSVRQWDPLAYSLPVFHLPQQVMVVT